MYMGVHLCKPVAPEVGLALSEGVVVGSAFGDDAVVVGSGATCGSAVFVRAQPAEAPACTINVVNTPSARITEPARSQGLRSGSSFIGASVPCAKSALQACDATVLPTSELSSDAGPQRA